MTLVIYFDSQEQREDFLRRMRNVTPEEIQASLLEVPPPDTRTEEEIEADNERFLEDLVDAMCRPIDP